MKTNKHGYKFTDKNNTKGGILATVFAGVSLVLLIAGITISAIDSGNAGLCVGMLGTAAFILSCIGLIKGLLSFREKDKFYVYSWVGTVMSGIIWIIMCLIIGVGFSL